MEELIRLGAYRAGSSPEVDEAIRLHEPLEGFLRQAKDEKSSLPEGYALLANFVRPSSPALFSRSRRGPEGSRPCPACRWGLLGSMSR